METTQINVVAEARPGYSIKDLANGRQREYDNLNGTAEMLDDGSISYSGPSIDVVNFEEFTP